ncbi:hypothetical protein BDQ17DRAFT_1436468 [Cyathus striatus]|nr:hypothetical protein BDQ17DRAFT_1436468 [Cyathus striatus]
MELGTTIILELDLLESASWMKMKDVATNFINYFDEFVPTSFDPNVVAIGNMEYRSDLAEGQQYTHFLVLFSDREQANHAIQLGMVITEDPSTWAPSNAQISWGVDPAAWQALLNNPPPPPCCLARKPIQTFSPDHIPDALHQHQDREPIGPSTIKTGPIPGSSTYQGCAPPLTETPHEQFLTTLPLAHLPDCMPIRRLTTALPQPSLTTLNMNRSLTAQHDLIHTVGADFDILAVQEPYVRNNVSRAN